VTVVRFNFTKPTPEATEVPVRVNLRFALSVREEGNGRVLTTNWFDETVYGPTLVDLKPTPVGQAWQVIEMSGSVDRPGVQAFLVPDDQIVHDFYTLQFVDPESLEYVDMADPAWVSAVEDLDARVEAIENLGFPPHTHVTSDITDLAAALSQTFEQNVASTNWIITHDLPYMPNVTVVDSAGSVMHGEIRYLTNTSLEIVFAGAFSGKAYLS
jgi:hypothetical protein